MLCKFVHQAFVLLTKSIVNDGLQSDLLFLDGPNRWIACRVLVSSTHSILLHLHELLHLSDALADRSHFVLPWRWLDMFRIPDLR